MQSNAVFARAHIFSDSRSSAHAKATTEHALIYFYVCMCVCMCISDTSMHVCMHAFKGFFCKNAGLEDDSDGCSASFHQIRVRTQLFSSSLGRFSSFLF
jgi:hypothetical protein